MPARSGRRSERMAIAFRPSELARIKVLAARLGLGVEEFVRRSALGRLPPMFDSLADELMDSAARAHASLDTALAKIAESEARLRAMDSELG